MTNFVVKVLVLMFLFYIPWFLIGPIIEDSAGKWENLTRLGKFLGLAYFTTFEVFDKISPYVANLIKKD